AMRTSCGVLNRFMEIDCGDNLTMRRHKLGIIGCGWVAPFHVQALNQMADRVDVRWVADPEFQRAESIARQIITRSKTEILTNYQDGLDEVNAVSILVPHHLHHSITVDALKKGCHVLLEKPFAISLAEADEMIDTAEKQDRVLMVA